MVPVTLTGDWVDYSNGACPLFMPQMVIPTSYGPDINEYCNKCQSKQEIFKSETFFNAVIMRKTE